MLQSEEVLKMLYCMAIMRLVNGAIEKTRKKNEVSIAEVADAIGIPRMLIDIRHECSHRDLPSLRLVRLASIKALDWLKSYYWEPQKMLIPCPSDRTANVRKKIKSLIHELAYALNVKQSARSNSSAIKEKRVKRFEHLCGRSKFISHMKVKIQSSKPLGSKRQINKVLKNLVQLYSSASSEVLLLLLEFLLREMNCAELTNLPEDSEVGQRTNNFQIILHGWKPLITKLSDKEPRLLLALLKSVLQMIKGHDVGGLVPSESKIVSLFEWLIDRLKDLKRSTCHLVSPVDPKVSPQTFTKETMTDLLRECLLVSPGDNRLLFSAVALARLIGSTTLVERLNKLTSLNLSNVEINNENAPESFLSQQEESINEAAKKLEILKQNKARSDKMKTQSVEFEKKRWVVAKSWDPCPIGMLPCNTGFSGRLPALDVKDDKEDVEKPLEWGENWELNPCGKRAADRSAKDLSDRLAKKVKGSDLIVYDDEDGGSRGLAEDLDGCGTKQMQECDLYAAEEGEAVCSEGVTGRLLIGGVWKKVTEEEVRAIASDVRILF